MLSIGWKGAVVMRDATPEQLRQYVKLLTSFCLEDEECGLPSVAFQLALGGSVLQAGQSLFLERRHVLTAKSGGAQLSAEGVGWVTPIDGTWQWLEISSGMMRWDTYGTA